MILTVDVEYDWGRETTDSLVFLNGLFDFLDDTGSSATLFVLGELAENVAERGVPKSVEIASHSMSHANLRDSTEEEVFGELQESKTVLEKAFDRKVHGFRAPLFMPPDNLWTLLEKVGYTYSSSLVAGRFPGRYNNDIDPKPFKKSGVIEFPLQSFRLLHVPYGLSFSRLLWPLTGILAPREPYIYYYHLTELLEQGPGPGEPPLIRLLYRRRGGRKARKTLYDFLESKAPTESVREFLS